MQLQNWLLGRTKSRKVKGKGWSRGFSSRNGRVTVPSHRFAWRRAQTLRLHWTIIFTENCSIGSSGIGIEILYFGHGENYTEVLFSFGSWSRLKESGQKVSVLSSLSMKCSKLTGLKQWHFSIDEMYLEVCFLNSLLILPVKVFYFLYFFHHLSAADPQIRVCFFLFLFISFSSHKMKFYLRETNRRRL